MARLPQSAGRVGCPRRWSLVPWKLALALLLAAGCLAGSGLAPTAHAETSALPAWSEARAVAEPTSSASVSTESPVDSTMAKAATVRQLAASEEVPLGIMSRDQFGEYVVQHQDEGKGADEREKAKAALVLLGLLQESDDLYALSLGLLTEQVAGFYEFDTHQMNLVEPGPDLSAQDEVTLAHEFVHALQDQNFDLGAKMKASEEDDEKTLALKALSEGDATLASALYSRQYLTAEQLAAIASGPSGASQEKLASAPLVLQLSLIFPYLQGMSFVAALYQGGGWSAVNAAYDDPPVSSEQIIHPRKYLEREEPKSVSVPDVAGALGEGWTLWKQDRLGELGLLAYLASGLPSDEARAGAAGWGGDQTLLLQDADGRQALVVATTWDTPEDAEEFYESVYYLRSDAGEGDITVAEDQSFFTWTAPSRQGYAAIRDSDVWLVISPEEGATRSIAEILQGAS